jgi:hypothetical protein
MAVRAAGMNVARQNLGGDPLRTARALRLAGTPEKLAVRVLDMETDKRDLSGPVPVAMVGCLGGWRPTAGPISRQNTARRQTVLSSVNRLPASQRGDVVGAISLDEKLHIAA